MNALFSIKNDLSPLLKLAIPLVLTGIVQACDFFFQTLFLAHVSQTALAAVGLASWLYATLVIVAFGTMSSINVLIAHKHGAEDHNGISFVFRDGIVLAFIVAVPSVFLLFKAPILFLLFGQHHDIVLLATPYLHALLWSLLPDLISIAILELMVGLGHTRMILLFTVLNIVTTILFSYLLIFGKLGFHELGAVGAGWAKTISAIIGMITLIIYVLSKKSYRIYCTHLWSFSWNNHLWELIKVGTPMGVMYCFEVAFFLALNLMMGKLGKQWLAANQVSMQYMGALMTVIFSIAQAITVRMGYLLGQKNTAAAKTAGYLGTSLSIVFMLFVAMAYIFIPDRLIALDFNIHSLNNIIIVRDIKSMLFVAAIFQLFEATRISLFGALRALKDTRFTLLTSILSFWGIAIPVGYCLAVYVHLNGAGFWWGMATGATISVILLLVRFTHKIEQWV